MYQSVLNLKKVKITKNVPHCFKFKKVKITKNVPQCFKFKKVKLTKNVPQCLNLKKILRKSKNISLHFKFKKKSHKEV